MPKGTVKWFNDAKGFGFIGPDGGGKDVFVHFTNIHGEGHRSLPAGARVAFELQKSVKKSDKMEAANVRILEGDEEVASTPAPTAKSASGKGGSARTGRTSKPGMRVNGSPPH